MPEHTECFQDNGVGLKDREPEIVQQEERLKTQVCVPAPP